MAFKTRSSVFALKEESSEGVLALPTVGSDYLALRDGFSMSSSVETVDSDELVNDIGRSKGFLAKETPSGSLPKYFKHSGTEGQAPDYALLLKAVFGSQTDNATEYDTIVGSTAGDSTTAGIIKVDVGEGANFSKGQGMLIKDAVNGYSIRNVKDISSDDLTLNYNLSNAPGVGVGLGKAIQFSPQADGHPTFSAHLWQSSSGSAYQQSMAGCRVSSCSIEFPANELASISFDYEGIKYYLNPVVVTASNKYIDFEDSSLTEKTATLSEKVYKTPADFAREIETKINAASADVHTVSWSNSTGKYTITSDDASFDLLFATGTNVANSASSLLGFNAADTGAGLSQVSDNEASYDPGQTPAPDSSDPNIVRYNEFVLGDFAEFDCKDGTNVSFSISTPKTDVDSYCAESGVSESVVLEREVTMSATLILQKHQIGLLDTFLNNGDTSCMFNHGPKSNGNWVAGKCMNVYMENMSFTGHVIADSDGFQVVEIEGSGFIKSDSTKDIYINFL